ncbi:MAG TPA: hypothetical protein VGB55_06900 [Tepidisphaeraceae bacterium]
MTLPDETSLAPRKSDEAFWTRQRDACVVVPAYEKPAGEQARRRVMFSKPSSKIYRFD